MSVPNIKIKLNQFLSKSIKFNQQDGVIHPGQFLD